MRSHVLPPRENELGLHNPVRRRLGQRADPPLRARQRGRVDLELARLGDVRCRGLQRGDVSPVSELGLEIAAE